MSVGGERRRSATAVSADVAVSAIRSRPGSSVQASGLLREFNEAGVLARRRRPRRPPPGGARRRGRRGGAAGGGAGGARPAARPRARRPRDDPRHGGGRRRRAGRPGRAALAGAAARGWSASAASRARRRRRGRRRRRRPPAAARRHLALPRPLLGRGGARSPPICATLAAAAAAGVDVDRARGRARAAVRRARTRRPPGRRPRPPRCAGGSRSSPAAPAPARRRPSPGSSPCSTSRPRRPGRPLPLIALAAPTGKAAARLEEAVHAEAAQLDVAPEIRDAAAGAAGVDAPPAARLASGQPQPLPPRPQPAPAPRRRDRRRDLDGVAVADGAAGRGAARRRAADPGRRPGAAGVDRGRRRARRHRRPPTSDGGRPAGHRRARRGCTASAGGSPGWPRRSAPATRDAVMALLRDPPDDVDAGSRSTWRRRTPPPAVSEPALAAGARHASRPRGTARRGAALDALGDVPDPLRPPPRPLRRRDLDRADGGLAGGRDRRLRSPTIAGTSAGRCSSTRTTTSCGSTTATPAWSCAPARSRVAAAFERGGETSSTAPAGWARSTPSTR